MTQPDFLHRTRALLGQAALENLARPLVAIAGLGGVGGAAFMTLLRSGVFRFRLAENGVFDPPDMNRQCGALGSTMGRPKIDVYAEWARGINPDVELELFPHGTSMENLEDFLSGADLHIGATDIDKNREMKEMGDMICRREGIPLFTAGAIGFGAIMINHHPEGMQPEEFWELAARKSHKAEMFPSYLRGYFSPILMKHMTESMNTGTLATAATGAGIAGLILGTEIINYLLAETAMIEREIIFAPRFLVADLMLMSFQVADITAG